MKISLILLTSLIILIISAPLLANHEPQITNVANTLAAPSSEHFFGTDNAGRDVFSRTLYGGQRSLFTAAFATLIAVLPALFLGILSGISPKWLDRFFVILLNGFLAFPSLLLALVILSLLGRGLLPIALATGLAQFPYYTRLVRGLILQNRHHAYIEAAEAAGANIWHLLWWHLLPNARPSLLAYTATTFGYCLINSAALSLLGLGTDPSIPDWGVMLATGRETFRYAPWAALAPATAISLTVIVVNRLADELNG